jgi:neutral ceramidase
MSIRLQRTAGFACSGVLAAFFTAHSLAAVVAQTMKAGFAEADITPAVGMEQPGGYGKSYHHSVHDPCKVRAAVFDDGQHRVAIVGIDGIAVHREMVQDARQAISQRTGIPGNSILICTSHSHSSGPIFGVRRGQYDHASPLVRKLAYEDSTLVDEKYYARVKDQVIAATCQADASRVDARCGIGQGHEGRVSFNRRFRMTNGATFTHPGQNNPEIKEPAGPIDPEVGVIGAWDQQGKLLGCLVNFACHATTNPGGISANYIYYLEQTIRGALGPQTVVVFLAGACGDVTQVDNRSPTLNPEGEQWAQRVGGSVGAEAVKALATMVAGRLAPLDAKSVILNMPRRRPAPQRVRDCFELLQRDRSGVDPTQWTFAKEIVLLDAMLGKQPVAEVEVQAIQIGSAVLVANPSEFFCQLGLDIKSKSRFAFTFPITLANGCVGYVPTEEAFGPHGGGYETRLTSYSNLEITAGPKIVAAALDLTRQMAPGELPVPPKAPPFQNAWPYGSVRPETQ